MIDGHLILEALPEMRGGRGLFQLYEAFEWNGIVVPKGYVTDLCSIPWFMRWLLPLSGKVAKPAVIHDWLIDHDDPHAADMFNAALEEVGIKPWKRKVMVFTVRWWQRYKDFRVRTLVRTRRTISTLGGR